MKRSLVCYGFAMHRQLVAGVALTMLLGVPARSADMLPRKAPPVPAPFSWTGGYIGISAGGAWGTYDNSTSTAFTSGGYFPMLRLRRR
jgi:outer membrane immunogenic protein